MISFLLVCNNISNNSERDKAMEMTTGVLLGTIILNLSHLAICQYLIKMGGTSLWTVSQVRSRRNLSLFFLIILISIFLVFIFT